jgi:capsid protein
MKKLLQQFVVLAFAFLAISAGAQTAGQDMKNAGHDTADATKQTAHKTAHATKKGAHKAAHATKKGANKVEEKTDPNNPK